MLELKNWFPELSFPSHPNPDRGYWAARTLNTAETHKIAAIAMKAHADYSNWAPNWCCITAIGDFNPDTGSHLLLWNIGIKICFPPSCSILFPSAIITHLNIPVQPGERWYLIVEYSAGGLFRWVYNGHKMDEDFLATADEKMLEKWNKDRGHQWKDSLQMYTKWYKLEKGDYKGEELGDCSELLDFEDETDDEQLVKCRCF
ncbi:hypothetical protein Moror_12217 [Moniliophthora roreri MCA 2997]|uniref:Uncharacterized protein n=1 Tax=Moniliophthora roreri (strain MCA 2997) TaxID=1381753 RepID=V2WP83_MONRO|nr:hypothetical protein Moror_12217 [Moniliophthora roreri MCA 2997]